MKKKDYTVTIIVVVGLFILTMMLVVAITPESAMQKPRITFTHKPMNTDPMAYTGRAHIMAIDQNVSGKVVVASTAIRGNGYVVIHKDEKGKPGKIIGASKMLTPGLYSNRWVSLTDTVAPGETLYAMLHEDNGDRVFSLETDAPMKSDDSMMGTGMVSFTAL